FRFGEQIPNQPLADLLRCRFASETLENISHQRRRSFLSQLFRSLAVGRFPRQKVIRRDQGEVVSRILQLHRVSLFAGKIDNDLIEQKVPLADPPKAPALMKAKSARLELIQSLYGPRRQLSSLDQFTEFCIHDGSTSYDERSFSREK